MKTVSRFGVTLGWALLAAVLAVPSSVAWPAETPDEEQPRWFGGNYDGTAMLGYGVPGSDYIMLNFTCGPGARFVNVDVQDEYSGAQAGELQQVLLEAGGEQIRFSDHGYPNEDSGGVDFAGDLPLNDALRRMLGSGGELDITIKGQTQSYPLAGMAELATTMLATCDAPKPPADLDVTVINNAKLPLQSFSWSQAGVNDFEGDAFGYRPLYPGSSRTFTIRNGRNICAFDLVVLLAENDAECCDMGKPAGTQDLCENGEFIVHD